MARPGRGITIVILFGIFLSKSSLEIGVGQA